MVAFRNRYLIAKTGIRNWYLSPSSAARNSKNGGQIFRSKKYFPIFFTNKKFRI